jgi:hypothetical protein
MVRVEGDEGASTCDESYTVCGSLLNGTRGQQQPKNFVVDSLSLPAEIRVDKRTKGLQPQTLESTTTQPKNFVVDLPSLPAEIRVGKRIKG